MSPGEGFNSCREVNAKGQNQSGGGRGLVGPVISMASKADTQVKNNTDRDRGSRVTSNPIFLDRRLLPPIRMHSDVTELEILILAKDQMPLASDPAACQ